MSFRAKKVASFHADRVVKQGYTSSCHWTIQELFCENGISLSIIRRLFGKSCGNETRGLEVDGCGIGNAGWNAKTVRERRKTRINFARNNGVPAVRGLDCLKAKRGFLPRCE